VSLKKPTDLFEEKRTLVEDYSLIRSSQLKDIEIPYSSESFDRFKVKFSNKPLEKVDEICEAISSLRDELGTKLNQEDLEHAMYAYLAVLDENFKTIETYVKNFNRKDLSDLKHSVAQLTALVNDVVEEQFPKYTKQVKKSEVLVSEKVSHFREDVYSVRDEVENKLKEIADVIDTNLEYFNGQVQETIKKVESNVNLVNENIKTANNLSKSLTERISKDNKRISKLESFIDESIDETKKEVDKKISEIKSEILVNEHHIKEVDSSLIEIDKKIDEVKSEIIATENHIKEVDSSLMERIDNVDFELKERIENVDQYLQENHKDLLRLRVEVFSEIKSLPIGNLQENLIRLEEKIEFIRETYSKINIEEVVNEVISEGLLNEPSQTKNKDPLTPLNQKFVTLDQLQEHYRLFLNRVQEQLSTLGGGGETRLKYLDDIVGIATNASAYDGQYLRYDHTLGKFVFSTPAADYSVDNWVDGPEGVYTQSRVGVGITTPQVQLDVVGTTQIIGQVNITGNMNVSGIVTATDFDSLSDVNLKTNVVVIENPLDKVVQLRGVNFDWKADNRPSMGVIAQEVEEILPQLVHGHETKTVNYNGLIGLLIECVKKQQEEINELKKRLP